MFLSVVEPSALSRAVAMSRFPAGSWLFARRGFRPRWFFGLSCWACAGCFLLGFTCWDRFPCPSRTVDSYILKIIKVVKKKNNKFKKLSRVFLIGYKKDQILIIFFKNKWNSGEKAYLHMLFSCQLKSSAILPRD